MPESICFKEQTFTINSEPTKYLNFLDDLKAASDELVQAFHAYQQNQDFNNALQYIHNNLETVFDLPSKHVFVFNPKDYTQKDIIAFAQDRNALDVAVSFNFLAFEILEENDVQIAGELSLEDKYALNLEMRKFLDLQETPKWLQKPRLNRI